MKTLLSDAKLKEVLDVTAVKSFSNTTKIPTKALCLSTWRCWTPLQELLSFRQFCVRKLFTLLIIMFASSKAYIFLSFVIKGLHPGSFDYKKQFFSEPLFSFFFLPAMQQLILHQGPNYFSSPGIFLCTVTNLRVCGCACSSH